MKKLKIIILDYESSVFSGDNYYIARAGLEPACPYGRSSLNAMRIPISPSGHI